MGAPLVTLVVCTRNRAALLDGALAAVARLRAPPDVAWELLVVDNGSKDGTPEVIARHAAALPLRAVVEGEPGIARARNRALEEARGELLLWFDDDVRVAPDWLRAHVDAARKHPDAGYFGGPIEPLFEATPPRWARDPGVIEGPFAALDLGPGLRPLGPEELPFGANMGLRREAVGDLRFDTRLGRVDGSLRGEEELALLEAMRDAGRRGVWVGDARVRHRIGPERTTAAYLCAYHYARGRHRRHIDLAEAGGTLAGVPWRWLVRGAAASVWALGLAPWRTPRWARAVEECAYTAGRIVRLRRGPPKPRGVAA